MATCAHFEPLKQSKYPLPENLKAACGFLTVPESRSSASGNFPGSRTLGVYVTVVKSMNENPRPDPIVFLYGGPGGNSAGILDALGEPQVQDLLLGQRDFIVFDHRGTGFSQPALFAPEVDPLWSDAFLTDFDIDERAKRFVTALFRARERFLGADINLAAVNTPEIAADLEDLRTVLGYAKINLWGVSYGTRIALAALRDWPEGIRSVILDSTVPIQISQYVEAIPNAHHTFNHLFDAVAADPRTHAAYPNLREVFYDVFERLNKTPVVMPAKHPVKKTAIKLRLTGEVFIGILCLDFYSGDAIAKMPDRIYRVYRGDHQELAAALIRWLDRPASDLPGRSQGMYYCVNCCDDKVSAQTAEQIIESSQKYPELSSLPLTEFALGKHIADIAEKWGARSHGPAEYTAVESDIPTLILAGEFDQNTPAYWGKLVGETLANSHYIELPGAGHGVINQGLCVLSMMMAFYDNPSSRPENRCVEAMTGPVFLTSETDKGDKRA